MTKLYKLTDEQGRTRAGEDNELTWAVGVEHKTAGTGTQLCTADVIHAYEHPLIAVLMNPVHAMLNPATMRLFVAEGEIVACEGQLKCGVFSLEIIEEIPVPVLTNEQRIRLAILSVKEVSASPVWRDWADEWLKGEDRSPEAAERVINFLNSAPKNNFYEAARLATWAALRSSWSDFCAEHAAKSIQMAVRAQNSLDLLALLNHAQP